MLCLSGFELYSRWVPLLLLLRRSEVGSQKLEVVSRKSEVRSPKTLLGFRSLYTHSVPTSSLSFSHITQYKCRIQTLRWGDRSSRPLDKGWRGLRKHFLGPFGVFGASVWSKNKARPRPPPLAWIRHCNPIQGHSQPFIF